MAPVEPEYGGALLYRQQDVSDTELLDRLIADIAAENGRLDRVVAAAGMRQVTPALNKGLLLPVYNSSKAAVIQLTRNLAMEWSPVREDGSGGIRVNCISPGHILTPMVRKNFEEVPGLRETREAENIMGHLAETTEFKGAVLFLLNNASSFLTGSNLVIDGGHTAW
ncbi:hypothetical protein MYCTH_2297117 [Thermothelomyces thermophilus ATCC 42464]|uniref:Uncharacterized protein n=1 Tax=Thermothelomyces thermophilus (strain ATCC 42464 / BCRC 31852 / DSM 1799) TaxID=573729 RepID=G2Q491_THET4|nr:uncharacterized protein MYCTH_2297117 [Thermothelomyces thermophilus ATCC 42464]AEO54486.1 hypothetical protein MYCTH_2297117 [Thermothelomyces thermophilus ATCC 42464]